MRGNLGNLAATSQYQHIIVEQSGNICRITLNRPAVLNAWTMAMRAELILAMKRSEADSKIRALVITGAGNRAFCAGQDLNEMTDIGAGSAADWINSFRDLYRAVRALSLPVVVALNGTAAGSAFQFALLCDVRIGHHEVRMGQPEINAGIASITGPWIMREMLGMSRTIELTLTGRLMAADEALAIGALHHLVDQDEVLQRATEIAADLAAKPPGVMAQIKHRFWEVIEPGLEDAMDAAIRFHEIAIASGETAAGTEKFLAKSSKIETASKTEESH
jgi:enoyl-CoA hydratase/carnithine racemase